MSVPTVPDATADKPPLHKRWIPLSLRFFVAINVAVVFVGILCFWYVVIRPMQNHSRAYDRISNSVQSLVHRRPAGVSRNEWSYTIGWTMNGIGNCCSVEPFLNPDDESHERFRTLPDRFD